MSIFVLKDMVQISNPAKATNESVPGTCWNRRPWWGTRSSSKWGTAARASPPPRSSVQSPPRRTPSRRDRASASPGAACRPRSRRRASPKPRRHPVPRDLYRALESRRCVQTLHARPTGLKSGPILVFLAIWIWKKLLFIPLNRPLLPHPSSILSLSWDALDRRPLCSVQWGKWWRMCIWCRTSYFSLVFLTVQAEVCLASGQNHMGETILWQLTLNVNNADLVKKL